MQILHQGSPAMLLLTLDPAAPLPLYRQIARQVAARIDDRTLGVGEPLPSSRQLAAQLGINRSTVCRAYGELQASGYLASTIGGRTTVRQHRPLREVSTPTLAAPAANVREAAHTRCIDFRPLAPDPRLTPQDALRRALNAALREEGTALLDYGDPRGYAPLRALIATRMSQLGAMRTSNEILLCNGAQHGLDLLLRSFVQPEDTVCVETPGYASLLPLLARHKVRVIGIAMKEEGMDLV